MTPKRRTKTMRNAYRSFRKTAGEPIPSMKQWARSLARGQNSNPMADLSRQWLKAKHCKI